jgi:hypothetical protein
MTLENSYVAGGYALRNGGNICLGNGTMNLTDNTITGGTCGDRGANLASITPTSHTTITGGTIDGDVDIHGTLTADDIFSDGGVSAKGIADFGTPSGAGGAVGIDVLRDDELKDVQENVTQVASAYAVRKIRDIINIDQLPKFSSEQSYVRGDVVTYNGEARQFTQDKAVGAWRSGITRPYDISAIATPLAIEKSWLKSVCEKQFGTTLN